MSEFDPKGSGEKLATLRAAIRERLDSGPAEPFDMEAILTEALTNYQRRKEAIMRLPEVIADIKREAHAKGLTDAGVDAEFEVWRTEQRNCLRTEIQKGIDSGPARPFDMEDVIRRGRARPRRSQASPLGRLLVVSHTDWDGGTRIISARKMDAAERKIYEGG